MICAGMYKLSLIGLPGGRGINNGAGYHVLRESLGVVAARAVAEDGVCGLGWSADLSSVQVYTIHV